MRTTGAFRYGCSLRISVHCERGRGRAPRCKCRYCGGLLRTASGIYGVFTWRGDGRYRLEDAHATYIQEGAADRFAARCSEHVVRFITDLSTVS
jgi:hypothetical protein